MVALLALVVVLFQENALISKEEELVLAAVSVTEVLDNSCDWMLFYVGFQLFFDEEELFVEFVRES